MHSRCEQGARSKRPARVLSPSKAGRRWGRPRRCTVKDDETREALGMELQPDVALVLLPGMDGTGRLFGRFLRALPPAYSPIVVGYPADKVITNDALVEHVQRFLPVDKPFALIAESFSGPIALRVATRLILICGLWCWSQVSSAAQRDRWARRSP